MVFVIIYYEYHNSFLPIEKSKTLWVVSMLVHTQIVSDEKKSEMVSFTLQSAMCLNLSLSNSDKNSVSFSDSENWNSGKQEVAASLRHNAGSTQFLQYNLPQYRHGWRYPVPFSNLFCTSLYRMRFNVRAHYLKCSTWLVGWQYSLSRVVVFWSHIWNSKRFSFTDQKDGTFNK